MASALPVNGVMNPMGPQQQPGLGGQATVGGVAVQDKNSEWQKELLMEKLRAKASTYKPLVETAKALRMAMLDKRFAIDSIEKAQLQKSLDALQHSIKVTSLQSMIERLECLSRQLGLKFMMSGPQGTELFISSDMFFLEVLLEPSGAVKDVKIHHEGKTEQQSCEELVNCLSVGDFMDFTAQLEGLTSIYQLNADKKVKCKAFSALQSLEMDLGILAQLQTATMKDPKNLVHKSPVGILERRKGGHAMKLTYFVSPYDLIDLEKKSCENLSLEAVISKKIGQSVTVCLEGSTAHKLPTSSIITVNRSSTGKNTPSYAPLTSANSSMLPACFVLKLATKMPMCMELIQWIQKVTEMECTDVSAPSPLLSMIVQHSSNSKLDCQNNKGLYVTLPDQHHCYFMTENKNMDGVLVGSIPFTHPGHVPQILVFLRQQALFNSLISSCVRSTSKTFDAERSTNIFEISALSWQCISVNFEHPFEETMATAELDLTDISALKCKLYGIGSIEQSSELGGKILQRCLSIPVTMRTLVKTCEGKTNGLSSNSLVMNGSGDFNAVKIKQEPGVTQQQQQQLSNGPTVNGRQQQQQQQQQNQNPKNQQEQQQQQSFLDAGAESSIGFPSYSGQSNTSDTTLTPVGGTRKRKAPGTEEILLDSSSSDSTTPSDTRIRTPTPTSNPDPLEILSTDTETETEIMEIEPSILGMLEDNPREQKKKPQNKSALVSPSVSITPIGQQSSSYNMLSNRPGIEIIPIASISQASLPSSITITAIKQDDKSKQQQQEKKKRRKRDESPMGPPQDPLTKPVSVTIKPSESPPLSPATRKFSPSPTHLGKSSPTGLKPSPRHSPVYVMPSSVSPKHSSMSSPKHGGSVSVGKPSMSALKSVQSSNSPKGNDAITITPKSKLMGPAAIFSGLPSVTLTPTSALSLTKIEKDRKATGAMFGSSSPKSKGTGGSSGVTVKPATGQKTGEAAELQISMSGGGGGGSTTPPSDFGKSVSTVATTNPVPRSRKGSLISAVIDKLKNAQHCTEDSSNNNNGSGTASKPMASSSSPTSQITESPTTPTSAGQIAGGMKERSKSHIVMSSGSAMLASSASSKTYTGLKPGVNSGPASKRPQTQITPKIRSPSPLVLVGGGSRPQMGQKMPGLSGLHKSSSIPNVLSGSLGSQKTGGLNRRSSSFTKRSKLKTGPSGTNISDISSQLLEGRMKLDTSFQIPKLSARAPALNLTESADIVDFAPKPNVEMISNETNTLGGSGLFDSKSDLKEDKDSELLMDFSPLDESRKNFPPSPPPPPPPPELNFVSAAAVPLSTVLASIPPSVSPHGSYPASPSVSLHIVKSPASPPRIAPSPSSASPCITDDELMDEALVGS